MCLSRRINEERTGKFSQNKKHDHSVTLRNCGKLGLENLS